MAAPVGVFAPFRVHRGNTDQQSVNRSVHDAFQFCAEGRVLLFAGVPCAGHYAGFASTVPVAGDRETFLDLIKSFILACYGGITPHVCHDFPIRILRMVSGFTPDNSAGGGY